MNAAVSVQTQTAKPQATSNSKHTGMLLQRKYACGSPTSSPTVACPECTSKKRLQTKLSIGASNDPLEEEADRVADQVLAVPANRTDRIIPPQIQRFTEHAMGQAETAPASVDQVLASSGRPLDLALRHDMELRFGHDFSRVRVHSGAVANQSARELSARAYTVGHNIVFGAGGCTPTTQEGRRLIAHELTHVVQQSGAAAINSGQNSKHVVLSPVSQVRSDSQHLTPSETRSIPFIQRSPDQDDDPVLSRRDEIALSKSSPGEFKIESGFPPVISFYNFGIKDHHLKKEHQNSLTILGELLAQMDTSQWQVFIVGHADSSGEPEINDPLSAMRADEVRKFLLGVAKGNFVIQGEGENRPIARNASISGRNRNRRVDLIFINPYIKLDIPDPIPNVCTLFPALCNENEFCERYPFLCGEGICAKYPEWCGLPLFCLLFPPACLCLAHPLACACGRFPALCACLANPWACLPKRPDSKDEPKRKKACPIKVDLPSGVIEAHKLEDIGFAKLWYNFPMNIDFAQDASGCECACGEYSQLVRGFFETDKTGKGSWKRDKHELTRSVYLHETTFQEDGIVGLGPYGHRYWDDNARVQPKPNLKGDQFLLTRETGCEYRGQDEPSLESPKKHRAKIRMYLEFVGGPVDVCETPGQRLGQQAHWRSWIIHGEAQAKKPPPGPIKPPTNSPSPTSPDVTVAEETDIAQGQPSPSWYAGGIPSDATSGDYKMVIGFNVAGATKFSLVPVKIDAALPDSISIVTTNKKNLNLNPDDPQNPVIVKPNHREQITRSVLLEVEQAVSRQIP